MININLNPKKKSKEKLAITKFSIPKIDFKNLNVIFLVGIGGALVVALEFAYYLYIAKRVSDLNEKKTVLLSEQEKYKDLKDKIDKIRIALTEEEKIKEKLNLKLKTLEKVSESKKPLTPKIESIVRSIPDGLWLDTLELSQNNGKVSGYSLNPNLISLYYKNLNKTYKQLNFNATEKKAATKNLDFYSFTFEFKN